MAPLWTEGDAIGRLVALSLLLMSVVSWVLIVWKTWLLWRVRRSLPRSLAAFWQSHDWAEARGQLAAFDAARVLVPLVEAAQKGQRTGLAAQAQPQEQLTRRLRDALGGVLHRLHYGQTLLASVGATAPFVGLLGTVWGIHRALIGLGGQAQLRLELISGPVGEALVMTAAGLAVAIPAVLAYNALGRQVARLEGELEGFAHDLRALALGDVAQDRS